MDFWVILGYIGVFLAGIGVYSAFLWVAKREAFKIVQKSKSVQGVAAKEEQSVRLIAFLGELKMAYDSSKVEGETLDVKKFAVEKAIPLCLKYPDVVLKHGKSLLKIMNVGDGKDDIGGLLEGFL